MDTPRDIDAAAGWPVRLQDALARSFSLDDLQDLCLRLGIDFEELGEGAKSRRIMALMRYAVANGRLDDLLDICETMRPHTPEWEEIRAAATAKPDLFAEQLEQIEGDGDFYQLSGDFSGATINIGSGLLADARSRRIALGVIIALLLLVGGGALYALGIFDPPPVPDTMDGDFNIAVAEFAVLDENGRLTNDQHDGGLRLAERVAQNLRAEFGEDSGIVVWQDSPELRAEHNVTIGVAADDVDGARPSRELADELEADTLIYGRVEPSDSLASQTLRFYLAPQFGQDFTNLVGNYVFSAPIPVFDPTRPAEEVWRELDPLSKGLAWLLLGLRQERIGEPDRALASFERAAEFVPDADLIHFFIGQENLFLAQRTGGVESLPFEAAAEAAFNEALRLNAENARAIVGLGSVQTVRAQRLLEDAKDPAFDGDPQAALAAAQTEALRALEMYAPVAEAEEQIEVYGLPVRSIARLGQGIAYRILGDAAYRAGDGMLAEQSMERASERLASAVAPLEEARDFRLMGQLIQAQGTVAEWQGFLAQQAGDADRAAAAYEAALSHYTACRDLGAKFPIDVYLTGRIVVQLCLPRIDALQQASGGGG